MKIRTDFVTNSSSSSFVLMLEIKLKNGRVYSFRGVGSCGEGAENEFDEFDVTVSPRELGNAKSVDALIAMLKEGVKDMNIKIFDREDPAHQKETARFIKDRGSNGVSCYEKAARFADALQGIQSMDDIQSVTITGNEYGQPYNYLRTFTYDRTTGEYTMNSRGMEFEKDGGSGGDLRFRDAHMASMFRLTNVDFINFKGRTFVFTGFTEQKKRELGKLVCDKGGIVGERISQDVQYLVVNTSYGYPTRKYNDAIAANEEKYAWHPYNVAIINEGTLREFAALPSGQVRDGGSPLRYSDERSRKELVDISYAVTELTVEGDEEVCVLPCAFAGMDALDAVTFDANVVLQSNITLPIKRLILGNACQLDRFASDAVVYVEMPVGSIDEHKNAADKMHAVCNYIRKVNAGESVTPEMASSYNAYMKLRRKALFELPDNLEIIRYMAKNALLTGQDSAILQQREDIQADTELRALLPAPKKLKGDAKTSEKEKTGKKSATELSGMTAMKKLWSFNQLEDGTLEITDYKGSETEIVIPKQIGENAVTRLSDQCFSAVKIGRRKTQKMVMEKLCKVTIPDSVTTIGKMAFRGCKGLADEKGFVIVRGVLYDYFGSARSVAIPSNVTKIDDRVFEERKDLASVDIPDGVTAIGDWAFYKCYNLAFVNMPNSLKTIGAYVFGYCVRLNSVIIPDGVNSISRNAFWHCSGLTDVHIPDSVTIIDEYAFESCTMLSNVHISDSVTTIGVSAFFGCHGLKTVNIPDSVTTIGEWAFCLCDKLETIHIPDSVTTIGDWAFHNCKGLADEKGFVIVRGVLYDYFGNARSIAIPDNVTAIDSAESILRSGVTITGAPGSFTETFAKENNIPFMAENIEG